MGLNQTMLVEQDRVPVLDEMVARGWHPCHLHAVRWGGEGSVQSASMTRSLRRSPALVISRRGIDLLRNENVPFVRLAEEEVTGVSLCRAPV